MAVVTVIGGANMDIQGFSFAPIRPEDSNPGRVATSPGGVGRNVAESLVRLGLSVRLLAAFGGDSFSASMRDELDRLGVDTSPSIVRSDLRGSCYLSLFGPEGRLFGAVSDMGIVEEIGPDWIDRNAEAIGSSDACVIDANLSRETIEHAVKAFPGVPFVLDTVSAAKAARAKECLGLFRAVKPNAAEARVLTGIEIRDEDDAAAAAARLHGQGVAWVFISLGSRGLCFSDGAFTGMASMPESRTASVNGSGDAACAAIARGIALGHDVARTARFAAACAALTLGVPQAVNPVLSEASAEALSSRCEIRKL